MRYNILNKVLICGILFICNFQTVVNAQYFKYINKAEKFIIEEKYNNAAHNYNLAFKKYNCPRSSDCYNMALVSTLLGRVKTAYKYMDSCVTKGYTLDYFESDFFKSIHHSKRWDNFLNKYDSLRDCYLQHKNNLKYSILKDLETFDQQTVKQIYKNDTMRYAVDSVFYKNGKRIAELIMHDSIPDVELFNFESLNQRSTIPWVLIRHYFGLVNRSPFYIKKKDENELFYQKVINDSSLYNELIQLIDIGKLTPHVLRDGLIYSNKDELFGSTQIKVEASYSGHKVFVPEDFNKLSILEELYYRKDYTPEEIEFFNNNRDKICLPKYNDELLMRCYVSRKKDLLMDNSKYWFQLSSGSRIVKYYTNQKYVQFEVLKSNAGININYFNKNSIVSTVFIPKRCIIKHIKYE